MQNIVNVAGKRIVQWCTGCIPGLRSMFTILSGGDTKEIIDEFGKFGKNCM